MAAHARAAHDFARQLFRLSLENGSVSPSLVAGVLEYVEAHPPANPVMVLKAYRRLITAELARAQAVVEHAGPMPAATLDAIAAELSRRSGRTITAIAQPNPALLAGLRIRVGDDIFESSVAGQLADLAASV